MRVPAAAVGASWWLLAAAACCCSLLRLFAAAAAAAAVAAVADVSSLMESAGVDRRLWLPETITERAFRLRDGQLRPMESIELWSISTPCPCRTRSPLPTFCFVTSAIGECCHHGRWQHELSRGSVTASHAAPPTIHFALKHCNLTNRNRAPRPRMF